VFYVLAIIASLLILLVALGAVALVIAVLAIGFVVTIPATATVLYAMIVYLQVETIWRIPSALARTSRWLTGGPDAPSTATDLPVEWSSSIAVVDRQLVHEIGYQLEAMSGQSNEFFGLVAFGTAITAAVALLEAKYAAYWGSCFALIASVAILGGYALSRYRFHPTELPPVSRTVVASAFGLAIPDARDLRVQFFKIRLEDSRTNADVIKARSRILLGTRATMALVVLVLGFGVAGQLRSESTKRQVTSEQRAKGHDGKAT
jgi:hypothetical protein